MIEIWRDIKDFEGLYQVSNFGRVRSLVNNMILKPMKDRGGYLYVALYKEKNRKYKLVHRLVAEAFIPNPLNLSEVNHKIEGKEGKQINTVENLEWCDRKYNSNYGTRNERIKKKNTNGKRSKQVIQFLKDGTFIREWSSTMEIERQLQFGHGAISRCCRGETKTYKGYIWKYKTEKEVA